MNQIAKAQLPNRNFRRLYWADNKEQIKEILSRVNIKYLEGLKKKFQETDRGTNGTRFYIRYDGYLSDLNNENKIFYEVDGELKCFIIHESD